MPLALAIADSADGTGGVATVSGTGGASTVTLYKAAFTGAMGALTWASAGTRTGDGTITLASPSPIALGFYQWTVTSLLSGTTTFASVYQNLTDATTAVLRRVLAAVATRIKSLDLAGVSDTLVMEQWMPQVIKGQTEPVVYICPGQRESFPGTLTGRDDVGLPVMVTFVWPANGDTTALLAAATLWRDRVLKAFRFQRLPGVDEVINCLPEPGAIFDEGRFTRANQGVSALGLRFISREARGLT